MIETNAIPTETQAAPRVKIGEELPIFCERCGYSLHGSPQVRCEHCTILQFVCSECGHHQPINTLRPAILAMLGRMRAWTLGLFVLARIVYFIILLMCWVAMGANWAYTYQWNGPGPFKIANQPLSWEMLLSFSIFGFCFGAVTRMILLRWRRGPLVGVALAGLVVACCCTGAWFSFRSESNIRPEPFSFDLTAGIGVGAIAVLLGASVIWPIWWAMTRAFLPKRAAVALLEWQMSLSEKRSQRAAASLGRGE